MGSPQLKTVSLCRNDPQMLRTGHTDHVNRRYGIKSDTLQWRQNEPDGVPIVCSTVWSGADQLKKTPKLRAAGLCQGNPPITAGFPWQRASNAVNVSIWWRHHHIMNYGNLCREGDGGPITRNMVIILAMMMTELPREVSRGGDNIPSLPICVINNESPQFIQVWTSIFNCGYL